MVTAYGLRVTLCATDRPALDFLLESLPGEWRPARDGRSDEVFSLVAGPVERELALFRGDDELVRTADVERVREALIGWVGRYFGEFSPTRTFIHAGVVARDGLAVLLPGRQNSGKTTLTAALVRAGAAYMSDEYAAIDDRGRVHPFARPLSFRQQGDAPPTLEPVERLGGVQETRARPVGLVALAPFTGARRWRPRRVTAGQAVLELLAYTVSAQTRSREALDRLGSVVTTAPVLKGGRGEAADTARLILRRLSQQ